MKNPLYPSVFLNKKLFPFLFVVVQIFAQKIDNKIYIPLRRILLKKPGIRTPGRKWITIYLLFPSPLSGEVFWEPEQYNTHFQILTKAQFS